MNNIDKEVSILTQVNDKKFLENMNRIKKFSENIQVEIELPTVQTDGALFGLFDYKVTGDDLNEVTQRIQNLIINQNNISNKIIEEFNTIYETFSTLNKDYLRRIVVGVKATEEASNLAQKGVDSINALMVFQDKTIKKLILFQEKIEKIEHLSDVGTIFTNLKKAEDKICYLENYLETTNIYFENELQKQKDKIIQIKNLEQKLLEEIENRKKEIIESNILRENIENKLKYTQIFMFISFGIIIIFLIFVVNRGI